MTTETKPDRLHQLKEKARRYCTLHHRAPVIPIDHMDMLLKEAYEAGIADASEVVADAIPGGDPEGVPMTLEQIDECIRTLWPEDKIHEVVHGPGLIGRLLRIDGVTKPDKEEQGGEVRSDGRRGDEKEAGRAGVESYRSRVGPRHGVGGVDQEDDRGRDGGEGEGDR